MGVAVSAVVIFFGVRLGAKLYDAITDFGGMQTSEFEVAVEIPDNPTVDQVIEALSGTGKASSYTMIGKTAATIGGIRAKLLRAANLFCPRL